MKKISELDTEEVHSLDDVRAKLNEVIQVVNSLNHVEEEAPIYELLGPHDVLIISRGEDGLLTVANDGWGRAKFERVAYPKEGEENE